MVLIWRKRRGQRVTHVTYCGWPLDMNASTQISGWRKGGGVWPDAWQGPLQVQTLLKVPDEDAEGTLSLCAWGLPPEPPTNLAHTLLEEMAWVLWAAPGAVAVIQPLYVALRPESPPTMAACKGRALDRVLDTGGIALLRDISSADLKLPHLRPIGPADLHQPLRASRLPRAPMQDRGGRATCECAAHEDAEGSHMDDPTALRGLRRAAGQHVLASTRALFEAREELTLPLPLKARILGCLDRWGRKLDDRLTSPPGIRILDTVRACGRQAMSAKGKLADRLHEDLFLAKRQHWQPKKPRADIVVRTASADDRVRVLMAMHWLDLGGAEKGAVDLALHLPRDRYAVYVTTDVPSENPWAERLGGAVEEIVHLPRFVEQRHAAAFFDHYIRTREIDLMHIHHSGWAYESLQFIRRFHRTLGVVDTLHILELPPSTGGYPEHSCAIAEPFLDAHHVTSDYLATFLRERWHVPDRKIHRVYTNVDTDEFDPDRVIAGAFRSRWGIPPDARVVAFAGRFVRQKQPGRFVEMAHLLSRRWQQAEQNRPLRFVMTGRGPLETRVRRQVSRLGLDGVVVFTDEIQDMRALYRDTDVAVLPSENEGLAFVTFEAAAMATPIVCTDVAAQSELLPPELLVPAEGNVAESLADAVWPLLSDPERCERVGRELREHILRDHRIEETWKGVLEMYEKVLGTRSSPHA